MTIAIPTRNSSKTVVKSIRSALNQSHKNIEVLVADDNSDDGTVEQVLELEDPRVRVVLNSPTLGLVKSRNRLLREAAGAYVAWQDSDDVSLPNRIALQLHAMTQDPGIEICGGWFTKTEAPNPRRPFLGSGPPAKIERCQLPNNLEYIRVGQLFGNVQPMSVLMMTRELSNGQTRQLDSRFESAEDCKAVSMSIAAGTFDFVNASVVQETKGPFGVNATQKNRQAEVIKMIMGDYARKLGFSNTTYNSDTAHYFATATGETLSSDGIYALSQWCQNLVKQNRTQKLVVDQILRWWLILLWRRFLAANDTSLDAQHILALNTFVLQPRWLPATAKAVVWKLMHRDIS